MRCVALLFLLAFFLLGLSALAYADSFSLVGYTKYENGTNMSSVNVSIEVYQFLPDQPPALIDSVSVLSGDEGNFTLGLGSSQFDPQYSYKPVLRKYSNGLAQYIGQSLPELPYFDMEMLNNTEITFYLKQAITVDISAVGIEHGTQDTVDVTNISIPAALGEYREGLKPVNESDVSYWALINNSDCLILLNATFEVNRTFCDLNITNINDVAYYPPDNSYILVNKTHIEKCILGVGGMNCTANATLGDQNIVPTEVGGIDYVLSEDMFYINAKNETDQVYAVMRYWADNLTFHNWVTRPDYNSYSPRKLFYYQGYVYEAANTTDGPKAKTEILRCSSDEYGICEDKVNLPDNIDIDGLARDPFTGNWYYSTSTYDVITLIDDPYTTAFRIFYQVKDTALGYPVKETFSTGGSGLLSDRFFLPVDRNYSIMIYPNNGPAFPGKIDLVNLSAGTRTSKGSADAVVQESSGALFLNLSGINMTTQFVQLSGYLHNSSQELQSYSNFTVIAYLIEGGNMVFKGATLPQNMGAWQWPPINDLFNATTGFYNMTLPASVIGANLMLFAAASDNSSGDTNYLGGFRTTTLTYGQTPEQVNFTLYPLLGSPRNLTLGFEGKEDASRLLTNLKEFVLQNASGTRASQAHVEIELRYPASEFPGSAINFSWMADCNQDENGSLTIPLLNYSVKKLNIFTQQYAPLQKGMSQEGVQGATTYINLTAFSPKGVDGEDLGEIDMMMFINKNDGSCSVPYPDDSCMPGGGEGAEEEDFDPFSLVIGGGKIDFEIRKADSNISVRYINVDLLASGPPDAMFDESSNASESGSALEEAWRFGSLGPEIYDYILIGVPYNVTVINESADMKINITKLYTEDWEIEWDQGINGTSNISDDYADYAAGEYLPYINGSGVFCNESDENLTTGICFKAVDENLLWFKIPHFSGIGPTIVGDAIVTGGNGDGSPSSSSSSSSSSGGGGGGGVPPLTNYVEKSSRMWDVIPAREEKTFEVRKDAVAIMAVQFSLREEARNAMIEVASLKAKPSEVIDVPYRAYQYLEIAHNLGAPEEAKLTFTVRNQWMVSNGIEDNGVGLYRYSEGTQSWEALATRFLRKDAENSYYEADSPGFSYFAVAGRETAEQEAVVTEEPATQQEEEPTVQQEEQELFEESEPGSTTGTTVLIAVVLIVLVAAVYFLRKKEGSGKKPKH
ncbi:PGF-pre-PGF domain-containing protein [Candidatus Woesearchaeota archaeon]|nr:PGF-pre-PGF domain-containing protein [Candidatus Woesearchaeota archaeon]